MGGEEEELTQKVQGDYSKVSAKLNMEQKALRFPSGEGVMPPAV